MKAGDKLRVDWSKKENDLMIHWPAGSTTKTDAHWISGIFDKEMANELKRRGYDIKTLKFSIEPIAGNEKFCSQRKEQAG